MSAGGARSGGETAAQAEPAGARFAALGIAPTLDLALVKRAYFERLKTCPPHLDPAGFSALRTAYEPLSTAAGLAGAFVAAPADVGAAYTRRRAEVEEAIRAGVGRLEELGRERALVDAFVAAMRRLRFDAGPVASEGRAAGSEPPPSGSG